MTTLYGIRHCDTVRKARRWLDAHGVSHAFCDYKKAGVDADKLEAWIARLGWEALLNRAGTTFRKLPEQDRAGLDGEKAAALMIAHPSLIRRPVLEEGDTLLVGFTESRYEALYSDTRS